jgi:predicted DsbA family dithiol-disulfide isomerase
MGGLLRDWQSYQDPLNAVHRPAQMAPQWFHVGKLSGVPVDERIWHEDPPGSSYPACIAVKAAGLQGRTSGERYLGRLRRAVMCERRNIARREVLLEVAEELAAEPGEAPLDRERFEEDLGSEEALAAFRRDLMEARYRGIGRFPTLTFHRLSGPGIIIVGYRPYDVLRAALVRVAPELGEASQETDRQESKGETPCSSATS